MSFFRSIMCPLRRCFNHLFKNSLRGFDISESLLECGIILPNRFYKNLLTLQFVQQDVVKLIVEWRQAGSKKINCLEYNIQWLFYDVCISCRRRQFKPLVVFGIGADVSIFYLARLHYIFRAWLLLVATSWEVFYELTKIVTVSINDLIRINVMWRFLSRRIRRA